MSDPALPFRCSVCQAKLARLTGNLLELLPAAIWHHSGDIGFTVVCRCGGAFSERRDRFPITRLTRRLPDRESVLT